MTRTSWSSLAAGLMCAVAAFALEPSAASAFAESTFDADLEGWTCTFPEECSWSATGGNPGGHLLYEDTVGQFAFAIAPAEFLGDWSALDGTGSLSFDHRVISEGMVNFFGDYFAEIRGPGGVARWTADGPEGPTGWVTLTAPIQESAWTVSSGSWDALLLDVQELRVTTEVTDGLGEIDGLDNVRLIPEPASLLLVGMGVFALARRGRAS